MLKVAPSSSSRFSRPLSARSTQSLAPAGKFGEAELLDIVNDRNQQAVLHRDHQADVRAARRHEARIR